MKKQVLILCAALGLSFGSQAQWVEQATGFTTQSRGIHDIFIVDPNIVWATSYNGAAGTPGQPRPLSYDVTRTSNGGTTWTPSTIGSVAAGHNFSNITAVDANTAWVAMYDTLNTNARKGGKILKTSDGGATWVHQTTAAYNVADAFPNVVHFWDANNGWTMGDPVGGYYEMYTTTDGGTNWVRVPQANIPVPISGEYGIVDVYDVVGNTVWFGTNRGRVYKSTDRGLNWTVVNTNSASIEKIVFSNASNGLIRYTSGANKVLKSTTDGGATWSTAFTPLGDFHNYDLAAIPGAQDTYISTGVNATGTPQDLGTSYSDDAGRTWVAIDANVQHSAVAFINRTTGWSGGFNQTPTTGGIRKYNGPALGSPATGLKNTELNRSLRVYPNPSTSGVFSLSMTDVEGAVALKVVDALGRVIFQSSENVAGTLEQQLDLSNFAKGLYLLEISTAKGVANQRLIVK